MYIHFGWTRHLDQKKWNLSEGEKYETKVVGNWKLQLEIFIIFMKSEKLKR